MPKSKLSITLALTAAYFAGNCAAQAQQSFYARFRSHNNEMTALQPSWMSPLYQSDPRIAQSVRLSFANSYTQTGTRTVNYGNYHTIGLLAGNRLQFSFMVPPYVQNNSAAAKDGFGDTMEEGKFRIASGNAQHGNYAVTALLCYSAPTGSHQNGALTSLYWPTVAAGRAWGRFNVQSTLGGQLPSGKIAAQGRQVQWNTTAQVHATSHIWMDIEDNAFYNYGGLFDHRTTNYITPAAFYLVRRKNWAPTHAYLVFDSGMQIATSSFHPCNHILISEVRIAF
jgi:hypothetical protein